MNSLADQLKNFKVEKEFGSNDIALLAPVPKVLLDSAIDPPWSGHVAFGSRNFEAFRKLDEIRKGESVDTLPLFMKAIRTILPSAHDVSGRHHI